MAELSDCPGICSLPDFHRRPDFHGRQNGPADGFPRCFQGASARRDSYKAEHGLAHLRLDSLSRLKESFRDLQEKMKGQGHILMQRQVNIDYELIAGFPRDDQYGPCIMFGLGGVLAEIQYDIVFLWPPCSEQML